MDEAAEVEAMVAVDDLGEAVETLVNWETMDSTATEAIQDETAARVLVVQGSDVVNFCY